MQRDGRTPEGGYREPGRMTVRAGVTVPRGTPEAAVVKRALADEGVKKFVDGKPIKKTIFVQDRLVNLVV